MPITEVNMRLVLNTLLAVGQQLLQVIHADSIREFLLTGFVAAIRGEA